MKILLAASIIVFSLSAWASCQDDAEIVRRQLASLHGSIQDEDHLKIENALGAAYSFCSVGQETDASVKLSEAQGLLAKYATNTAN